MNKQYQIGIGLILAIAIGVMVIIYAGVQFQMPDRSIKQGELQPMESGWYRMEQGSRIYLADLPGSCPAKNGTVTIYHSLPQPLAEGMALYVESRDQSLRAEVDGTIIYSLGLEDQQAFGGRLGNAWNLIPLERAAGGKTLKLTFSSAYETDQISLPGPVLGERTALLLRLQRDHGPELAMGLGMLTMAVLLFVQLLWMGSRSERLNGKAFFNLALFILFGAIWMMTDNEMLLCFFPNRAVLYYLSYCSFLWMPVPLLLFLSQLCTKGKRLLHACGGLLLAYFGLAVLLLLTGVQDLRQSLPMAHILMVLSVLCMVGVCILEYRRRHRRDMRSILIGMGILGVCYGVGLADYYLGAGVLQAFCAGIGFWGFILSLVCSLLRQTLNTIKQEQEFSTLAGQLALPLVHGDGSVFWCRIQAAHTKQEPEWYLALFDLTEQKQVEEQLYVSEESYRIAAKRGQTLMLRCDLSHSAFSLAEEALALLALPEDGSRGETSQITQESMDVYLALCQQMKQGVPEGSCLLEVESSSGSVCYQADYVLIFDPIGHPTHGLLIFEEQPAPEGLVKQAAL